MSLADRPIICKNLQFLVTNIILSIWIQDSKLRKNFFQSNLFRFKIQDSRLRKKKKLFNPTSLDLRSKIQGSEKTLSIQPLWIQNSRFKAEGLRIQEVFLGSWILNPTPLGSRSLFGFWILNLESYILNLESYPLGFKKSFWDLESWILDPMYLGKGGMGTNLQQKML